MPSRLANLIPELPEKQTIGPRRLLAREFGSHLLIIAQALAIAKPMVTDETKGAVLPVYKLSFHVAASGGNIPHLQIIPQINIL
jgi:hypothetical protein